MTLKEAKQILLENRPYKPHGTKGRLLQAAIDVIIPAVDGRIAEIEFMKQMANSQALEEMERAKNAKNGGNSDV